MVLHLLRCKTLVVVVCESNMCARVALTCIIRLLWTFFSNLCVLSNNIIIKKKKKELLLPLLHFK